MGLRKPSFDPTLHRRLGWSENLRPGTLISENRGLAARTYAWLYGIAAIVVFATLSLPGPPERSSPVLLGLAVAAVAIAAAFIVAYERTPRWALHAAIPLGVVMVVVAARFTGEAMVASFSMFLLWPVFVAFFFFGMKAALGHTAFAVAAYAVLSLAIAGEEYPAASLVNVLVVLVVAGVLMGLLRLRVETLANALASAAHTDALTGVANRRGFDQAIAKEIDRARRGERQVSLIICDLDHFKQVNDTLGHAAGDETLKGATAAISESVRSIDTIARLGGEEFAVIAPDTDARGAFLLAERVRQRIRSTLWRRASELSASCGVATFPEHGTTPKQLLHAADQALYSAKQLGRDRSVIYSPDAAVTVGRHQHKRAQREERIATVLALIDMLDQRQDELFRHSREVGAYVESLAAEIDLVEDEAGDLRLAAMARDVGMLGMPESIIDGSGSLTGAERIEYERHPELGARILRNAGFYREAAWVAAHHERIDGSGYPLGLRGEEIQLEAQLIGIAESFQAKVGGRAHTAPISTEEAIEELERGAGSEFDAELVQAFVKIVRGPVERLGHVA